jgi:choline kinase
MNRSGGKILFCNANFSDVPCPNLPIDTSIGFSYTAKLLILQNLRKQTARILFSPAINCINCMQTGVPLSERMKRNNQCIDVGNKRVYTALLLAAGMGSRLSPLTDTVPKCLVRVNEISILERLVQALRSHGFKRLVVVVGHQAGVIRDFLGTRAGGMEVSYITSPLYKTTNNIYSLWLAREAIKEPFLLIESDLVFDTLMLKNMLRPDRIAVARLQSWMNGTTVSIDHRLKVVKAFCSNRLDHPDSIQYKTVNIYSFSSISWQLIRQRLDMKISNHEVNEYYETVFAEMVADGSFSLAPVFFDANRWYEIDTIDDLHAAEQIFSQRSTFPAGDAGPALLKAPDMEKTHSQQANTYH